MAIHSFCHLEEPVPQNNDLKKAHLFARKSLHLGISTDATKRCFFKFRLFQQNCYFPSTASDTWIKLGLLQRTESCIWSLTFSGMRISELTTGDSQAAIQVWIACQKSVPKLECKASRVLMMNKNGYLEDNNGYGLFKSSGILVLMLPLDLFKWISIALGPDEVLGALDDCKFLH